MLTILISWIYAFLTMGILGFGSMCLVERLFGYRRKCPDTLLMVGIIAATVYSQIFSLFCKVSLLANVVLIGIVVAIAFFLRVRIKEWLMQWKRNLSIGKVIAVAALVVMWCYFTSRGYIHYDSDLYHAQSIRWLEEYGVVPGLGNLHERFAYNSSFFALSALYSLKFVMGYSMHAMSGYVALVLSFTCLPIARSWKEKRFRAADMARIAAIYYLTTIADEVVSPASDYVVMCVIFFIVIKWLDLLQEECQEIAPYALLCVVGVYALTLKLTAGLILLLLIKPAYQLLREKKWKEIFGYLGMGLVVALPWLIRTIVISGWLFYPFTAIDLFDFDWEMNAALIDADAMQIKVWGRALYDIALIDVPVWEWFPNWFYTTLSGTEKLLILADLIAVVGVLVYVVAVFMGRMWRHLDTVLVCVTLVCCYVFWQTSAPLIRYGYVYVLLLAFVVYGFLMERVFLFDASWMEYVRYIIYFGIMLYGGYKVLALGSYVAENYRQDYYVFQEDYGEYDMVSYEINGVTFYYPVSGDRGGYQYFPSTGTKVDLIFRGETMEDGFRK